MSNIQTDNQLSLSERYRPTSLDQMIGQKKVIGAIKNIFDRGWAPPHFLFNGPSGTGKSTLAYIIAGLTDWPVHEYNASDDRGIDWVRNEVSSVAGYLGRRWIILQEADRITDVAQDAFRRIMETTEAKFILTCNHKWRINDAIQSRCSIFDFQRLSDDEVGEMVTWVLDGEGVSVVGDDEQQLFVAMELQKLIKACKGDLRAILNILEQIITKEKEITIESVALASSTSTLILIALERALSGNFEYAKNTIEKAYAEGEYNPKTTFMALYDAISLMDGLDLQLKIRMYQKLADTEARCRMGGDPIIHLTSFCAWIWLAPHLPQCPVMTGET